MEKTISIGGKDVKLKTSAAFALRYKQQFRRDPLGDIMVLAKSLAGLKPVQLKQIEEGKPDENTLDKMSGIDLELLYNITWALAKCADNTIPEPLEFFDQFESFSIKEAPTILELVLSSMGTTVAPKKKIEKTEDEEPVTLEILMNATIDRGLTLSDFKDMEIGAIIDYIITYNNLHFSGDANNSTSNQDKDKVVIRRATQDDWDRFSSM